MYECPYELKQEIAKLTKESVFTGDVLNCEFVLRVHTYPNVVPTGIETAFQIVELLFPHAKCPPQTHWQIELLWTRNKKELPKEQGRPLSPVNANTGYAYHCGKIVVYRKEEWVKTLIHECFHSFNLDAGLALSNDFGVPALLSEVFSEVWARIILCSLKSTPQQARRNLELERNFSCAQCAKVLEHYGKTYDDVILHTMQPYTEHTNIFAYYILGAVALHVADELVPFETKGFHDLLLRAYKSPSFLRRMQSAGNSNGRSLRMTRRNLF